MLRYLIVAAAVSLVTVVAADPAPGRGGLAYAPPTPGSYALPSLGEAADGNILLDEGETGRLHDLMAGRYVVLSFIYSTCNDVNGCPLATHVLSQLKKRIEREAPELAPSVRLISLSFDPEHDTPEVMRLYGAAFARGAVQWRFITTTSALDLKPVLDAYGQVVARAQDERGNPAGFSHVLRVYLIDLERHIRNIYSVAFLHPGLILNDLLTIAGAASRPTQGAAAEAEVRLGAGDAKSGYESANYRTDSLSLDARQGKSMDLLEHVLHPSLGLPPVPIPQDNPLTAEKIALGRKLFYDRRLSLNRTMSCAMCHIPEQGFTNNELATSVGFEGRTVRRNAPTILNAAYQTLLFHDGRETRIEYQVWHPMLARNEMAATSFGQVIGRITESPDYAGLFETAFGAPPGIETIGMAIASYERTLISGDSPFDRWHFGGDAGAVNAPAKRGFALFTGKAGCSACHTLSEGQALFSDGRLHNTGWGWHRSMALEPERTRVQLAPGVFAEVPADTIRSVGEPPVSDLGRYEVTQDPADRWKYRTPTLRNVALTAPYMHDGGLATLREVIDFYDGGGFANENLSPLLYPLGLSDAEKSDLESFLEALTGSDVAGLIADAQAAPIGN